MKSARERTVYRIIDSVEGRWWYSDKGKSIWIGADRAMSAWNSSRPVHSCIPVFSKQSRFILRPFVIHSV